MRQRWHVLALFVFIALAPFVSIHADAVVKLITAGTQPGYGNTLGGAQAIAVNPVTNKIYVANYGSADVTVIDGATNLATAVIVGMHPVAVAINPVTNRVYVVNQGDNNVTVINGATDQVIGSPVGTGLGPLAIAVNPVTNRVYVANQTDNSITIIDTAGDADTPATVPSTGIAPTAVAVNPVTNKIYIANQFGTGRLTVLNGADNTTAQTAAGSLVSVVVDPATNIISAADVGAGRIYLINGADNTYQSYSNTTAVGANTPPTALAVNPVTNTLLIMNPADNSVNVAEGGTVYPPATTLPRAPAGTTPAAIAINPTTNKMYVANSGSNNVTVVDGEDIALTTTVSVGAGPSALAVNPVTNKIYVANTTDGTVSVIDGVTATTSNFATTLPGGRNRVLYPVAAGTTATPSAADIGVNPKTNKVYVANSGESSVTVIDASTPVPIGATSSLTLSSATVAADTQPSAIAVDPQRNMAWVANAGAGDLIGYDGANNPTPVAVGLGPSAIAINEVTGFLYVANSGDGTVTVYDPSGVTPAATVPAGTQPGGGGPRSIAVDPAANKVYVANYGSNNVTVIDGNHRNTTTTVPTGTSPRALAVNPLTGKVYVANYGSDNVTIIDPANILSPATVSAGTQPLSVTVDPAANKIYVASFTGVHRITIIDGTTGAATYVSSGVSATGLAANPAFNRVAGSDSEGTFTTLSFETESAKPSIITGIGGQQVAVAVDPFTNRIYTASSDVETTPGIPANVGAIDQAPAPTIANPLTTAITPLTDDETQNAVQPFTFTVTSGFATIPDAVYYQVDSMRGLLRAAPSGGGVFTGNTPSLLPGLHVLYAFATDGQESAGSSMLVGKLATYMFLVLPAATIPRAPSILGVLPGDGSVTVTVNPPPSDGGSAVTSYTVTSNPGGFTATGAGPHITVTGLTNGTTYTFTAYATNAIGDSPDSAPSAPATPEPPFPTPPTDVVATAQNVSSVWSVHVSWTPVAGVTSYKVFRKQLGSGFVQIDTVAAPPYDDLAVAEGVTYVYMIISTNVRGSSSPSTPDYATTLAFTDPVLTGVPISVTHLSELRTAVTAVMASIGATPTFTDPVLVAGTTAIKAVHFAELRTQLNQVRSNLGMPSLSFTDPTITPGVTPVQAVHLYELRAGTQ